MIYLFLVYALILSAAGYALHKEWADPSKMVLGIVGGSFLVAACNAAL